MARLFSRMNAGAVDGDHGHFEPDPDHGGFDLPDDLADALHAAHFRGKPAWETEEERNERLHGEESDRKRDPETLYNAVADIANVTKQLAGLQLGAAQAGGASEVEALKARIAELESQQPEDDGKEPESTQETAPKSRSRGKSTIA